MAHTLDARGLICPMPALKARKRLAALPAGAELILWTDDPAAATDIPELCASAGHRLAATEPTGEAGGYVFTIEAWGAHAPGTEPA